jgi:hypothetical protein
VILPFRYLTGRLKRLFCVASTVLAIFKFSRSYDKQDNVTDQWWSSNRCDLFQPLRSITRIIVRRPPESQSEYRRTRSQKGLNLPLRYRRPNPSKGTRNIFERWRVSSVNTKRISVRGTSGRIALIG